MEKCIIMGNGYEIRKQVKLELMEVFECEENDIEVIIEEHYSKVDIIAGDIIHQIGGNCISEQKNPGAYGILADDEIIATCNIINFNEKIYTIKVFEKSYGSDNSIKTLEVELSMNSEFAEFDNDFYEIKLKIKDCIKNYYKEVYFIEDTQNAKACMMLYGMVYMNENKFRSIINKHMVINYGTDWFKKVIDKTYQDSVVHFNTWYIHQPEAEFKNVRCELYNILIDDLIDMLKDSQLEGINSMERKKYFKLYDSLPKESILKSILGQVVINKETIWEKNFSSYIDDAFEQKWAVYKNMRNMVAHNKLICRNIMEKITQYSNDISSELEKIEARLNRIYHDNERAYIQEIYEQINEEFYIEEAGGSPLPDEDDVLLEIIEDENYSNMINELEDKLHVLRELKETVAWQIEQVVGYDDEESIIDKSAITALYRILETLNLKEATFNIMCIAEITSQNLLEHFMAEAIRLLKEFKEQIEVTDYSIVDSFQIGELFSYQDIYGEKVMLNSKGIIMPSRGTTDDIKLHLYVGATCISWGIIEKGYFDYSIHKDEGYGMPEQEDNLFVDIHELSDTILSKVDLELNVLNSIIQILEDKFANILE